MAAFPPWRPVAAARAATIGPLAVAQADQRVDHGRRVGFAPHDGAGMGGPCVRATMIRRSSSRQGEEVRNGAAIAIGWLAMKLATRAARSRIGRVPPLHRAWPPRSMLEQGWRTIPRTGEAPILSDGQALRTADRRHQYKVLLPLLARRSNARNSSLTESPNQTLYSHRFKIEQIC